MKGVVLGIFLLLCTGCSQGPEGRDRPLPTPEETPATEAALANGMRARQVSCIRNLTDRQAGFTIESHGSARDYSLHPGEALHFRDSGNAMVRFTSTDELPSPNVKSRLYLIALQPGRSCRHVFRLTSTGGIDLFGARR